MTTSSVLFKIPDEILNRHLKGIARCLIDKGISEHEISLSEIKEIYQYNLYYYEITIFVRDRVCQTHGYTFLLSSDLLNT